MVYIYIMMVSISLNYTFLPLTSSDLYFRPIDGSKHIYLYLN